MRPLTLTLPWRIRPQFRGQATLTGARTQQIALALLTLVGLGLRVGLWTTFPLREDEAIYSYWARQWLAGDWLFLYTWPDKPPLFLWSLAGVFALLGPSEASARWLNIIASTLTIPLVAVAARRLWPVSLAAPLAALLLAFNPFAISFSATVYTDPFLALAGMAALTLALCQRPGWAGVLLGAAILTKQQGLLYIPLIVGVVLLTRSSRRGLSGVTAQVMRLLAGLALIVLPVVVWDSLRWAVAPSPWALAATNYAPVTLAPLASWGQRLGQWAGLLWYLAAAPWAWLALGGGLLLALGQARHSALLALILAWGLGWIGLHVGTTVQVWDRYLLPLAPWLALIAGGALAGGFARWRNASWRQGVAALLLIVVLGMTVPAWQAAQGYLPIGGDHGDYAGLREALDWLAAQEGPLLLYHQSLGWHYRFYLYDALQAPLGAPERIELRCFPSTAYLADNAAKMPYPPKYLIVPDWSPLRDLPLHAAQRGLRVEPKWRGGRFTVMEIVHLPRPACDWCKSMPHFLPQPLLSPDPARMSLP